MDRAIELDPEHEQAFCGRAWIPAAGPDGLRNGPLAVEAATRACELTDWKDAAILGSLAAAHAECGAFERAISAVCNPIANAPRIAQLQPSPPSAGE
jgi:hypothetical protein